MVKFHYGPAAVTVDEGRNHATVCKKREGAADRMKRKSEDLPLKKFSMDISRGKEVFEKSIEFKY